MFLFSLWVSWRMNTGTLFLKAMTQDVILGKDKDFNIELEEH